MRSPPTVGEELIIKPGLKEEGVKYKVKRTVRLLEKLNGKYEEIKVEVYLK